MKAINRLRALNNQVGWKRNVYGSMIRDFSTATGGKNVFNAGVFLQPHYAKRAKGGEDAACLNSNLLVVADGVGGWAESGIDPAIYSKRLCAIIDTLYATKDDRYLAQPKELLIDAVNRNDEIGSCTVCLVHLDESQPVI